MLLYWVGDSSGKLVENILEFVRFNASLDWNFIQSTHLACTLTKPEMVNAPEWLNQVILGKARR